jgi:hypothetical protein
MAVFYFQAAIDLENGMRRFSRVRQEADSEHQARRAVLQAAYRKGATVWGLDLERMLPTRRPPGGPAGV